MEKHINDVQDTLEKVIRKFLEANKELELRRIIGADGLHLTAGLDKNIFIDPVGAGKAYYKGVEIGTGGGGGVSNPLTSNLDFAGYFAFGVSHITGYDDIPLDFLARELGINYTRFRVTKDLLIAYANLDMQGFKIKGLAAGTVAGDAIRYEQLVGVYLPLVAGNGSPLTGSLYINTTDPNMIFQDSARGLGQILGLSASPYSFGIFATSGHLHLGAAASSTLYFQVNYVDKLTLSGSALTSSVPLAMSGYKITGLAAGTVAGDALRYEQLVGAYLPLSGGTLTNDLIIKDATPMLYFTSDADAPLGSIGSLGAGLYIGNDVDAGSIYIRTGATPATRMQIYDTGIDIGVNTSIIKSNPILTLKTTAANSPVIHFRDSSNNIDASLYTVAASDTVLVSNFGALYLSTAATTGGNVYLETKGVTRLTVADAGITVAVPLAMSSNKITGLAAGTVAGDALRYEQLVGVYLPLTGGTMAGTIFLNDNKMDFRTDNVHKIFYGGTTPNDLVYSTYTKHRFYTTSDTTTDFEICYNGIRCYDNFYLRQGFANDTCYIKNDASGTMELHVPSGQRLKVIIG